MRLQMKCQITKTEIVPEVPKMIGFDDEQFDESKFDNADPDKFKWTVFNSIGKLIAQNITPFGEEFLSEYTKSDVIGGKLYFEVSDYAAPELGNPKNLGLLMKDSFDRWTKDADDRFNQLKSNEEELNRIFIDLYGLQDELTPEVKDEDVSVRRADLKRDISAFMSYFVGCTFGRYSLDKPGLIFAGGEWLPRAYHKYTPNETDFILLSPVKIFNDQRDIIYRLREFLVETFGPGTVDENMAYIANALTSRTAKNPEDEIRGWMFDHFYKDEHVKTYKKRPIYWQINSGKAGGLRGLMYLHRYEPDTVGEIREDYLNDVVSAYELKAEANRKMAETATGRREQADLINQQKKFQNLAEEASTFDDVLKKIAFQRIVLDLDDGVVVNHKKLQSGKKFMSPIGG